MNRNLHSLGAVVGWRTSDLSSWWTLKDRAIQRLRSGKRLFNSKQNFRIDVRVLLDSAWLIWWFC